MSKIIKLKREIKLLKRENNKRKRVECENNELKKKINKKNKKFEVDELTEYYNCERAMDNLALAKLRKIDTCIPKGTCYYQTISRNYGFIMFYRYDFELALNCISEYNLKMTNVPKFLYFNYDYDIKKGYLLAHIIMKYEEDIKKIIMMDLIKLKWVPMEVCYNIIKYI